MGTKEKSSLVEAMVKVLTGTKEKSSFVEAMVKVLTGTNTGNGQRL